MKKCRYNIFILIFFFIISMPLLLTKLNDISGIRIDKMLNGHNFNVVRPKFTIRNYQSGAYQKEFMEWWDNSFFPRGALMRTYNQLRKTAFGLSKRVIFGKNEDIFEENYINEFLGISEIYDFSNLENKKRMDKYIEDLNKLSLKFKLIGKELIVYSTPSKVSYNYTNIPKRFYFSKRNNIRGIDYFRSQKSIFLFKYFDGYEILNSKKSEYPIFYNTGIHLSRISEIYLNSEILKGIPSIKGFHLDKTVPTEKAQWRDSDIYDLSNIWFDNKNIYYEGETIKEIPDKYESKIFTIQGGSFGEGLRKDIIDNYISGDVGYIFYNLFYQDKDIYIPLNQSNSAESISSDWSEIDLKNILSRTDVLIIELNEKHITYCSNGFIEYLNNYLEMNSIGEKEYHIKNLNIMDNYDRIKFDLNGYHNFENNFVWVKKYSSLILKNRNIINKGMDLKFEIPKYWDFKKLSQVKIYINGEIKRTITVDKSEELQLYIAPDELGENDIFVVEIYASQEFNPKKIGLSNDDRDISVMIKYIGEAK